MTDPQEIIDKMLGKKIEETEEDEDTTIGKLLGRKGLKRGPQDGSGPNEDCEKK